jgi:hypothetical protein
MLNPEAPENLLDPKEDADAVSTLQLKAGDEAEYRQMLSECIAKVIFSGHRHGELYKLTEEGTGILEFIYLV